MARFSGYQRQTSRTGERGVTKALFGLSLYHCGRVLSTENGAVAGPGVPAFEAEAVLISNPAQKLSRISHGTRNCGLIRLLGRDGNFYRTQTVFPGDQRRAVAQHGVHKVDHLR
jgi:hypothetical protein